MKEYFKEKDYASPGFDARYCRAMLYAQAVTLMIQAVTLMI